MANPGHFRTKKVTTKPNHLLDLFKIHTPVGLIWTLISPFVFKTVVFTIFC